MVKNNLKLFLITSLIFSILAVSPAVYGQDSGRVSDFNQCLGKPNGDCEAKISQCTNEDSDKTYKTEHSDFDSCKQSHLSKNLDNLYPVMAECMLSVIRWHFSDGLYPKTFSEVYPQIDATPEAGKAYYITSEDIDKSNNEVKNAEEVWKSSCKATQEESTAETGQLLDGATETEKEDMFNEELARLEAQNAALSGKIGGDSINPVPSSANKLSVEEDKDLLTNPFFSQLKGVLSGKDSLSGEQVAAAIKAYRAKISNVQKGQAVTVELPQGLIVQSMTAITAQPIADAVTTITLIDEAEINKAVPLLGGKGIIGNPDYPIPQAPTGPPDVGQYLIRNYFAVYTSGETAYEAAQPFYERAWFKFSLESSVEAAKNTILLRYNEKTNKWNPLPTQHILSVAPQGLQQFTAESPGTSYFAIVVEKESGSSSWTWIIILLVVAAAAGYYFIGMKKKRK